MFNLFDEQNDRVRLYLEIKAQADRIGDRAISDMVRARLAATGKGSTSHHGPAQILAFPGCMPPLAEFSPAIPDWPSQKEMIGESLHLLMSLAMGTVIAYPVIGSFYEHVLKALAGCF